MERIAYEQVFDVLDWGIKGASVDVEHEIKNYWPKQVGQNDMGQAWLEKFTR